MFWPFSKQSGMKTINMLWVSIYWSNAACVIIMVPIVVAQRKFPLFLPILADSVSHTSYQVKKALEVNPYCSNHNKSCLLFLSAEMFKKPLWQTVWTQIRLLL